MNGNVGIVRVELNHMDKPTARALKDTIREYREAAGWIIDAVCKNYADFSQRCAKGETPLNIVESLIHRTKENPCPACETFDVRFYKFPSYLRRAAIHTALGHIDSHQTRCTQYEEKREKVVSQGKHYKQLMPAFHFSPNACPVLYQGNLFAMDGDSIHIKGRIRNTWDWVDVRIPHRDYQYLRNAKSHGTLKNPTLVYQYHKFYLFFPVQYAYRGMKDVDLGQQTVLSVDQGLNHGAVCSVVNAKGDVLARFFDPFRRERSGMQHIMNLIRKKSRTSGKRQKLSGLYTKLQGMKENYTRQLSRWIVNIAIRHDVYGIVLEHLGRMKGKKNIAMRLQHWCKAKIWDCIKDMAFREGIRTFLVNPNGTSLYAYDGSGPVERDSNNYSLCRFRTGKQYHCDLSASYNIGARYFLRAYKKSISATKWSKFVAKVHGLSKGTVWTLDTLRKLSAVLCPEKASEG